MHDAEKAVGVGRGRGRGRLAALISIDSLSCGINLSEKREIYFWRFRCIDSTPTESVNAFLFSLLNDLRVGQFCQTHTKLALYLPRLSQRVSCLASSTPTRQQHSPLCVDLL